MGFETMRRWPVFVIFAFCLLLCLSLLNSWSSENILNAKLQETSAQLEVCSKQQAACLFESMETIQQRDSQAKNIKILESEKVELKDKITEAIKKAIDKEILANRTQVDVELCKTELQSSKNLQLSKSATLETLRLEKDRLNEELSSKNKKIEELEKEIMTLKVTISGKTSPNVQLGKATSTASISKPKGVIGAPIDQPEVVANDNNAKEDEEEINANNDGFNDFNDDPNK